MRVGVMRRDPTMRFSGRVEAYARHRPGYPRTIVDALLSSGDLRAGDRVADIGCGTGRLSVLFLDAGCHVVGVEPNDEMRAAAETLLAAEARFESRRGRAEETGLPEASVDLAVAGQAFHWFDRGPAREEMNRILRPGGKVFLIWNVRLVDASPFMTEYDRLLQVHSMQGERVGHHNPEDDDIRSFFVGPVRILTEKHSQHLDEAGLEGRLLSSSYVPEIGHPGHGRMMSDMRDLFDRHERGGRIAFEYEARGYLGRLSAEGQT